MEYSDIGDNELIYLIRADNEDAREYLFKRYQKRIFGFINSFSNKYSIKRLDYEDYFQDCFIVFLKCLENFDEEYNFLYYVSQSIERLLFKLTNKEMMYRSMVSIDDEIFSDSRIFIDEVGDSYSFYRKNEILDRLNTYLS